MDNSFQPLDVGHELEVSHLLFVDDILIFGEVNNRSAMMLNRVLENISCYCGLNLNYTKSTICFSKNMRNYDEFCKITNLIPWIFPIKYLDVPLQDCNMKAIHFSPILDKFYAWLAG